MTPKRTHVPTNEEYQNTIAKLIEEKNLDALVIVRLGCEMGLTRIEIANVKVSDLDRMNKRSLWVEIAKQVRRGSKHGRKGKWKPNYEMRSREVPVNISLYQLLISYIDKSQIYITKRHKGKANKPFTPRNINTIYEKAQIPWSTHRSRHYFKSRMKDWMRKNHMIDDELMKDLLGHQKDTTELYGNISWDYKLEVVDGVFQ